MPLYHRPLNVGSITYAAGQKKTLDIPRDGPALQYNIRVRYTITNGGSAAVAPFFQTLARLIRRVDVVIGGRDTVVSQSGEMLAARAVMEHGAVPDGMADTVVLTGSAATAYDVTIPIPRFLPRSRTPFECADNLPLVSQATMEITWGDHDDIYGTPNSAAISLVTCDVEVEYLDGVDRGAQFMVRQLSEISETVAATNSAEAITVDGQTGLRVRSLAIASLVDNVGSNTPMASGKIKIQAASFVHTDRQAAAIQSSNKTRHGVETPIAGFYFLPFTFAGDSGMAINTHPSVLPADLKAIFDYTVGSGTHRLILGVESIRPPRLTD
jgi:hypothetical protein